MLCLCEHHSVGYLLNSAADRIGALSFGVGKVPPAPVRKFNKTVDLKKLIQAAHKLEQNLAVNETERDLLMAGPSAGGARPKTTVEHENHLWLAKFPAINDRQQYSYLDLADQMRRWIKNPKSDLKELFKRMVFNGLVSNTDDHPRNQGFLFSGNSYNLSPVYDIVPKPETGSTRYLAMEIGRHGRVFNLENILSRCDAFDLSKDEAKKLFDGLKSKLKNWHAYYSAQGLTPADMKYLEGAFNHWDGL